MSYDSFGGVLCGHHNYLVHMCFPNFIDYDRLLTESSESKRKSSKDSYKELRYFLNAIESFNNVLDYLFWEYRERIEFKSDSKFKERVHAEFPILGQLADLANAYKHCVRKGVNEGKISAEQLQENRISASIYYSGEEFGFSIDVKVGYEFSGVMAEHNEILGNVWAFWIEYHQNVRPEIFTNLIPDSSN